MRQFTDFFFLVFLSLFLRPLSLSLSKTCGTTSTFFIDFFGCYEVLFHFKCRLWNHSNIKTFILNKWKVNIFLFFLKKKQRKSAIQSTTTTCHRSNATRHRLFLARKTTVHIYNLNAVMALWTTEDHVQALAADLWLSNIITTDSAYISIDLSSKQFSSNLNVASLKWNSASTLLTFYSNFSPLCV